MTQIERITFNNIISNSNLYKLAGNSICINQLEHIFENYMIFDKSKRLNVIELFAGYGSQNQALKNLGYKTFTIICEWWTEAIVAYALLHHFETFTNELETLINVKDKEIKKIFEVEISSKYNLSTNSKDIAPNLSRYKKKRELISAQRVLKNYGDITKIVKLPNGRIDLLTYSFPCQDISNAGNQKGFENTSTRSGLVWEVLRVLKASTNLPKYLLMENVKNILSKKFEASFAEIKSALEELGYKNEVVTLDASKVVSKSFPNAIPQKRIRVFMISTLKEGL